MSQNGRLLIVGRDAELDGLIPDLAARGLRPVPHDAADPLPADATGLLAATATADDLHRWRASGARCPILCLARTAPAVAAEQLAAGADGLLVPPFGAAEVALRLAVARRRRPARLRMGARVVDLDKGHVLGPDGQTTLTPIETRLLGLLAAADSRPVSRADLHARVWGFDLPRGSRALDNAILRLRAKLEPDARHPRHVLTVHQTGYRLWCPPEPAPPPPPERPLSAISRAADRAAVEQALEACGTAWVWGPAGVGKSHLAAGLVADRAAAWIPGAGLAGIEPLSVRLAMALHMPLPIETTPARLGARLAGRGALSIIFDGLDDIESEAAAYALVRVVEAWRQAAPQCRFVLTARRRLDVPGAHRMGPLDRLAARAFFLAAAARHGPPDGARGADAERIADRIVDRVGALPQTLLLTAARLRYCSLEALLHGVESDTGRTPGAADALAAAFDRSWERLDPWRRALLTGAALFEGPFDLTELESFRPVADPLAPPSDTLVDDLIGSALIEQVPGCAETVGPGRLRLMPAIRGNVMRRGPPGLGLIERYALRRIEAGERAAGRLVTDEAASAGQTLTRLEPDLYALADDVSLRSELRVRARLAVGELQGHRRILAGHAEHLAALAELDVSPQWATRLTLQRARFLRLGGRHDQAGEVLDALPIPCPAELSGRWALERCWLAFRTGRLEVAAVAVEAGLRSALTVGDRLTEGELLERRGALASRQGELQRADASFDEARRALNAAGAVWPALIARGNQALVARSRGDLPTATGIWVELIERAQAVSHGGVEIGARLNLAATLVDAARHEAAAEHLATAEARAAAAGLPLRRALALYHRARSRLDQGRPAGSLFSEARALSAALGDSRLAAAAAFWEGVDAHVAGRRAEAVAQYEACGPALVELARELVPVWVFARRRLEPGCALIPDGPDRVLADALRRIDSEQPVAGDAALAARSFGFRMALRLVER